MLRMNGWNRAMIWGTSGVAAAVLALTACSASSGDDDTEGAGKGEKSGAATAPRHQTKPGSSVPDEWAQSKQWAALPRGKRTDSNGNEVLFPHTAEGAVSMLSAANSTTAQGSRDMVDEQMGVYDSYLAAADQTPTNKEKVKQRAIQTDAALREKFGIPAKGDMPPRAYSRVRTIGFKVIKKLKDEVSVYILARVTMKAGAIEKTHSSYTRTLLAAEWDGNDWKMSSAATLRAAQQVEGKPRPAMALPGTKKFNRAGWTAPRGTS
ncbi:hypothetical protein GCM10017744_077640 [Streptomyces antimycoticus]|uniref:Lipoprotein n=1 Tax=Streptomyces antimycoticus TaxID=68175 RepID=A0A4D4JZX6_9ACTN|nr:hypothetical protein [Streptomyces antimycoticus]GDY41494.1 hypothetical protein SANT12839_023760 [Streptomyces antimycoticus]